MPTEQIGHALATELEAETAVMRVLEEQKSIRVLALLDSLRAQYSMGILKLALAKLLHQGRIQLTSDRTLRAA